MFNLVPGQYVLGQAKIVIDDIHGHRETLAPMIAAGQWARRALTRMWKWFLKRLGYYAALIAMAAALSTPEVPVGPHHVPYIMGAITSAVASSFKTGLGKGLHDFTITTGHSVKTALYTSTATLGASTTAYSSTNEITGTGYTATGVVMANVTPVLSGTTCIFDWADAQWTTATFTANGSLSYDDTASGDPAMFVIAFGSDQTVTVGTFTIQWPAADASNAIVRF